MKDHRFIELLNLYIDRQITVAETAELEAEIQQSPARQAVYRQYCQIHSATKMVYDSFRANAAGQPVLQPSRPGEIELFETKRGKSRFAYYAGGLAAAACLTLVFMHYNTVPAGTVPVAVAKTEIRPASPAAPVTVAAVPTPAVEPVVGLVSLRNTATATPDYSAMLAALREQDEERAFASGHLQSNRGSSLFDDGVFNPNRTVPTQGQPVIRPRQTPAQQQAEFTAFQFQR